MDTKIRDERWLYEDADQLFVSPQNEDAVKKWGQLNYVVMKEGDPHPNSGNVLPDGNGSFSALMSFIRLMPVSRRRTVRWAIMSVRNIRLALPTRILLR